MWIQKETQPSHNCFFQKRDDVISLTCLKFRNSGCVCSQFILIIYEVFISYRKLEAIAGCHYITQNILQNDIQIYLDEFYSWKLNIARCREFETCKIWEPLVSKSVVYHRNVLTPRCSMNSERNCQLWASHASTCVWGVV